MTDAPTNPAPEATARERTREPRRIEVVSSSGPVWLIGWLFTIGYARLDAWDGFVAVLLWPWYLGWAVQAGS